MLRVAEQILVVALQVESHFKYDAAAGTLLSLSLSYKFYICILCTYDGLLVSLLKSEMMMWCGDDSGRTGINECDDVGFSLSPTCKSVK